MKEKRDNLVITLSPFYGTRYHASVQLWESDFVVITVLLLSLSHKLTISDLVDFTILLSDFVYFAVLQVI